MADDTNEIAFSDLRQLFQSECRFEEQLRCLTMELGAASVALTDSGVFGRDLVANVAWFKGVQRRMNVLMANRLGPLKTLDTAQ